MDQSNAKSQAGSLLPPSHFSFANAEIDVNQFNYKLQYYISLRFNFITSATQPATSWQSVGSVI